MPRPFFTRQDHERRPSRTIQETALLTVSVSGETDLRLADRHRRDDAGCVAADGKFQEFVVLRVTTCRYRLRYFNNDCHSEKRCEETFSVLARDVTIELIPVQDVIQFLGRGIG